METVLDFSCPGLQRLVDLTLLEGYLLSQQLESLSLPREPHCQGQGKAWLHTGPRPHHLIFL